MRYSAVWRSQDRSCLTYAGGWETVRTVAKGLCVRWLGGRTAFYQGHNRSLVLSA